MALIGLLALMVGVCGALYAVAASHVDPEVELVADEPPRAASPEPAP